MSKITFEEAMEAFFPEGVPWHLVNRPKPAPTTAAGKANERWSAEKRPLSGVLQDAGRAEAAATERLRREREAENGRSAAEYRRAAYQAEISAAWERSAAYRDELARWGGCNRGPWRS
jgi:hypothetical protein